MAIQSTGHPIYFSGYEHKNVADTHLYDINLSYRWDTQEQPSDNGKYRLDIYCYNEHGQRVSLSYKFVCSDYVQPDDETAPDVVDNVRVIRL